MPLGAGRKEIPRPEQKGQRTESLSSSFCGAAPFWLSGVVLALCRAAKVLVIGNNPDDFAILRPRMTGHWTAKSVNNHDDAAIDYDNAQCSSEQSSRV